VVNINGSPYVYRRLSRALVAHEREVCLAARIAGLSVRDIAWHSERLLGRRLSKSSVARRLADALYLPDATATRRCPACGRTSCSRATHG
jgi:hypothetical protein